MLAVAILLSLRETGWLLVLLGVILFVLSILCVAPILSDKARQHGFFKTAVFCVLSAIASWAGGKGGRGQNDNAKCKIDNEDGRVELRTGSGNNPRSVSIPVLPDAADVGEADGFGEMPVVTNLDICGIARWTNATELVFGWTPSTRPVNDLAWIYAGTNLPFFEKMLPVDVSRCVSNALVSVYDSDIVDTNVLDKAFYSVGDEKDTDDDGVSDADERFVYHTNFADPDTDADGITDGDEILLGTSPLSTDTDLDGIDDGDELGWISRYDGFEWYDSTDWKTEYGSNSLGSTPFLIPYIPLLTSQLSPAVPFYDRYLSSAVAYQSGYVSLFSIASGLAYSDPFLPLRSLAVEASNYCDLLVVPYWMDAVLAAGDTNSYMRIGYVASNNVHVVEYHNMIKQGTDLGVTMQVIIPADSNKTVRISYLSSDFWLDGENAVVGVQNKGISTTNGYYNLTFDFMKFGPILPYTTWVYHLGYATDPTHSDTDSDGFTDDFELFEFHSDPLRPDGDGDGLTDIQEYALGTNPKSTDTDGDGLPDGWEVANVLDPLSSAGDNGRRGDPDQDGLVNRLEYNYGTNPQLADTDGDGLSDLSEVSLGTNPLLQDSDGDGFGDPDELAAHTDPNNPDSDYDGISDGLENSICTNPLQPDSDGDGMNDGWELLYAAAGFNPLVSSSSDNNPDNDVNADPDGDGLTNGQECDWGTNPSGQDTDNDSVADGYDTDGDGVNDGAEVAQNSDPNDASDGGLPNSRVAVSFTFGDPSGSVSEKYSLELLPVDGIGEAPRSFVWVNSNYGECETKTAMLKQGWKYEIRLRHAGTNIINNGVPTPDYDYELAISGNLPSNALLDDTSSLFGTDESSSYFAGEGKVATISICKIMGVSVCSPDDPSWSELDDSRVVLDNELLKIRIDVSPRMQSLSCCTQIFGDAVLVKTSGTCPAGAQISLNGASLVNTTGKSEIRISKSFSQLRGLGLLPQSDDGVNEMAVYDVGTIAGIKGSNLTDSDQFANLGFVWRCKATGETSLDLYSTPPNSQLSKTFLQAAGSETIEAVYVGIMSSRKLIMNQSDYFYYSGHGLHSAGYMDDYPPTDFAGYWTNDLDCVIISGCSILDINDYNNNYSYDPEDHDASPGIMWATVGPDVLLGYAYSAPEDTTGAPARIMQKWIGFRNEAGNVDGWMKANDSMSGHNACAIERLNQNLIRYKWFRRTDHTAMGYHIFNTYKVNTEIVEVPK